MLLLYYYRSILKCNEPLRVHLLTSLKGKWCDTITYIYRSYHSDDTLKVRGFWKICEQYVYLVIIRLLSIIIVIKNYILYIIIIINADGVIFLYSILLWIK